MHDSVTELKELARKFLVDLFGNSQVPPAACLVDFSEVGKCAKKLMMRGHCLQSVRGRDSEGHHLQPGCAGERFVSATVVSDAEFFDKWLNPAPGRRSSRPRMPTILTAIYDGMMVALREHLHERQGTSQYLEHAGEAPGRDHQEVGWHGFLPCVFREEVDRRRCGRRGRIEQARFEMVAAVTPAPADFSKSVRDKAPLQTSLGSTATATAPWSPVLSCASSSGREASR